MAMAMKIARSMGPSRFRSLFSTVSTPYKIPMADPSTNLKVDGLNIRTTDDGLREAFAKFGEVVHARVVRDCASEWSKGFGFVQYSTLEGAAAGIKGMDCRILDGYVIFAEYAKPSEDLNLFLGTTNMETATNAANTATDDKMKCY